MEISCQNEIRIGAAKIGCMLWRNNVGVLYDAQGRPVRYGLGNDTKAINERLKSSDLIGIYEGRFVSVECKDVDWTWRGGRAREIAQLAWINLIRERGGVACFATCWDDLFDTLDTGHNRHP